MGADLDGREREVVDEELAEQLLAPLPPQRVRGDDHDPAHRLVEQNLADHEARLNRLAQADLVGEQVALDWITDDRHGGVNLVPEDFDAGRQERERTPARRALRNQVAQHRQPGIGVIAGLVSPSGQDVHGVAHRPVPPDPQLRLGNLAVQRGVGESHEVRGLIATDDPPCPPGAGVGVLPVDPRLVLQFHGAANLCRDPA